MSWDGWAALLCCAIGLSAVCDCGISWSYSLTIFGYNIYVLQLTACLIFNPITVGKFAVLFNCMPVGRLQILWWFWLNDLFIDEMVGAWCFSCCQVHQGLPVGFFFALSYSVLFTVEALSVIYPLLISSFICSRRWCIGKFGVFHAKQTSVCLDSHLN